MGKLEQILFIIFLLQRLTFKNTIELKSLKDTIAIKYHLDTVNRSVLNCCAGL